MLAPTASPRAPADALLAWMPAGNRLDTYPSRCATLTVTRVGYLASALVFDGVVHSVFARACNVVCECGLLTIAANVLADGPTVWRLAVEAAPDLRHHFRPGERLHRRHATAATRGALLDLTDAEPWRPPPLPPVLSEGVVANLRFATMVLEHHRRLRSSVVDREAQASLGSLENACRRLDIERATAEIHRLVGWGEGLTPAGDDAIIGLVSALGALAEGDADRLAFLRSLSTAIDARAARTTVISGHYLGLAAQGHFNADVTRLAHALVGGGDSDDGAGLHEALQAALAVGATSGADMVAGMIAGFRAWGPANSRTPTPPQAARSCALGSGPLRS